ncbi:MAG: hypothetical protein ACRDI0_03795 [Actinomycetota bacterium]
MGLVAHAGGWDELLVIVGAVLILVVPKIVRDRRARADAAEPERGPCLYCGRPLGPGVDRCPGCGFRARRVRGGEGLGAPRERVATAGTSGGGR